MYNFVPPIVYVKFSHCKGLYRDRRSGWEWEGIVLVLGLLIICALYCRRLS